MMTMTMMSKIVKMDDGGDDDDYDNDKI